MSKVSLVTKNEQIPTKLIKYGTATQLEQSSPGFGLDSGSHSVVVWIDIIISCQDSPVADLNIYNKS